MPEALGIAVSAKARIERASMRFEPGIGRSDIAFVYLAQHGVECWAVIEMNKVCHFMGHYGAAHEVWRLHQTPIEPDTFFVGATAPPSLRAR